jgi:hypothetical protein
VRPKAPPTGFSLKRFIARQRLDVPGSAAIRHTRESPIKSNMTSEIVAVGGQRFRVVSLDGVPVTVYRVDPDGSETFHCHADQFLQGPPR